MGYDCGIHGDPPHKGHCPYCAMYEANQKVKAILKENIMTHPLPPSLALIVKAEAEKRYGKIPDEEFFGGDFSQQDAFIACAQFLFVHLSGPGEACGPRFIVDLFADTLEVVRQPETFKDARKVEYVPLAELLQARAALASSEARVRALTAALDGLRRGLELSIDNPRSSLDAKANKIHLDRINEALKDTAE